MEPIQVVIVALLALAAAGVAAWMTVGSRARTASTRRTDGHLRRPGRAGGVRSATWRSLGDEADAVGWRFRRLLTTGLDMDRALALAEDWSVDVHELIDLVARGCPPDLAVRIVGPVDARDDPRQVRSEGRR